MVKEKARKEKEKEHLKERKESKEKAKETHGYEDHGKANLKEKAKRVRKAKVKENYSPLENANTDHTKDQAKEKEKVPKENPKENAIGTKDPTKEKERKEKEKENRKENIHGVPTLGIIGKATDHGTGPLWAKNLTKIKVEMRTHNNNNKQPKQHWAKIHRTQRRTGNIAKHAHKKEARHATAQKNARRYTDPHAQIIQIVNGRIAHTHTDQDAWERRQRNIKEQ